MPVPPSGPGTPWRTWSGLVTARPRQVLAPASAAEVSDAVRAARAHGLTVRMVGSGHSFTDVAVADGLMLTPERLRGVVAVDRERMTVTVLAGTPLHELNARLAGLGLALHNMGDIDRQTVAGAVSTGTHGTGGRWASLSAQLIGVELVTADGSLLRVTAEDDPDLLDAVRVSMGALGVLTSLTFAVEPAFVLAAHERPMSWDQAVGGYDELTAAHHHVDMYWFPHTDRTMVKTDDRTVDDAEPLPPVRAWLDDDFLSNTVFGALVAVSNRVPAITPRLNGLTSRVLSERSYSDQSHRVFVSPRRVVFREMEYAVPAEVGMKALTEVRDLMDRSGWRVAFPVEIRRTPADTGWLSSSHGRASVYLAFHVPRDVDHRSYFTGVEQVLRAYDGRPHWGKLHGRTAADLAPAYPRWADFAAVRDRLDPDRLFANAYLDRVLGP